MASQRKTLLVVHHSQSGGTRQLVNALRDGVQRSEDAALIDLRLRSAAVATADDLLQAQAYVFATPENFGYMAGSLKDFFDRTFYRCMRDSTEEQGGSESLLAGRPYVTLVCAGNDGTGAQQSVARIVTGWRLRAIHPGLIARRTGGAAGSSRGELRETDLTTAGEIGASLATGLAMGTF